MLNPVAQLSGPGGGLPPSTLDGVSGQIANKVMSAQAASKGSAFPGVTWKSFFGQRLYDTARVVAGTALSQTEFPMFVNPIGAQQTALNGTTNYQKSLIDTNMQTSRSLPAGEYAWITSIQVRVVVVGTLDNTTQTGANLSLANDPGAGSSIVAGDDYLSTNNITAALEGITIRFEYNQTPFEKGPLYLFPTRYVCSGVSGQVAYAGGGSTASTIIQNESLLQNGIGFVYTLPVVREIQQLYQFGIVIQPFNPFVPNANFRIVTILEGLGAKSVTG